MVKNESIARIVMLLCFGTALLSLAVHWHISNSSPLMMPMAHEPKKPVSPAQNEPSIIDRFTSFLKQSQINATGDSARATSPLGLDTKLDSQESQQAFNEPRLVVDLSNRRVYVYQRGEVIASYPTGIGKKGWETPTGIFQVIHKQHDPVWRHPITGKVFSAGADSPLGDRWIGFLSGKEGEVGFHGTPDDTLVGNPVSHGCLRMRNPDVRMLYDQIKIGTVVEVRH
ncbi:ErfK/YbiS/YcfS/YnhG family protein [Calothrix sp. NIES-4071]|nr:ErfK/YbiS/YcfS/YnhG family protein [Calothrix sp. NIES-4071]BAZ64309.1 ErfK/YbiS/YcfS/YnhG family protein [Calothrix sp. NIES-4105]